MKRICILLTLCFIITGCFPSAENEKNPNSDVKEVEEEVVFLNNVPATDSSEKIRGFSTMASAIQARWTDKVKGKDQQIIYISEQHMEYVYFDEDGEFVYEIHDYNILENENDSLLTESYDPRYTVRVLHQFWTSSSDQTIMRLKRQGYFLGESFEDNKALLEERQSSAYKYLGPETSYDEDVEKNFK